LILKDFIKKTSLDLGMFFAYKGVERAIKA